MKRKIEFVKHPHALSVCKSSVIVGIAVLLVLQFVFSLEQSAFTYGGVIVGAIFQYIAIMRKTEKQPNCRYDRCVFVWYSRGIEVSKVDSW
ncbi:hypothetical protein JCM19239_3149 [Vibrio variabilis]|uniref:Uncharacterized protein n=1 Tax=Vibrio variabilis TaxID=990271 RepID=A0ABQ0JR68_9VIBR|nr:hypothetical protein JCM19239_3149 [Vibrio variabilis]